MKESTLKQLQEGVSRQLSRDFDGASEIFTAVLAEEPDNPDANHLMGLVYNERGDTGAAIRLIEKAIQIKGDAAAFHHNIAGIYRRIKGRDEDARREFRRAIELKPDYGEAYQGLAEMVRFEPGDPLIGQISSQLNSGKLTRQALPYFHFAAGKYFDDIAEYDQAFSHYTAGNQAADRTWDAGAHETLVRNIIYQFGQRFVRNATVPDSDERFPIFIVGMPRSGTSLVEQILASHSEVVGAGELNDMKMVANAAGQLTGVQKPYPLNMPGLDAAMSRRLAAEYKRRIADVVGPVAGNRVVDKHPLNFHYVGLILAAFPHAKIVHTIRHPLDTCLSCYFQNFTTGQDYSFDLTNLGAFYNHYRRLMEYWDALFPGRILHVEYERVTDDQEGETRRLLAYCDLEFEQQCLDFHDTDREVKTASFLQVRQPLYKSSRQRWRRYARHLEGLARQIGVTVDTPITLTSVRFGA